MVILPQTPLTNQGPKFVTILLIFHSFCSLPRAHTKLHLRYCQDRLLGGMNKKQIESEEKNPHKVWPLIYFLCFL